MNSSSISLSYGSNYLLPAYLKELVRHKCICGKNATVEVYNNYNILSAYSCRRCGQKMVRELTAYNTKAARVQEQNSGRKVEQ